MGSLALNQPGMGDDASFEATQAAVAAYSPSPTGSILDTIMSSGSDLLKSITSADVVKATLNKYVFGKTAPIPTATNVARMVAPPPATDNTMLYVIGGAALLLFVLPALTRGRR